jgi:hypothetical protein
MRISEVLDMNSYFHDKRFQAKKPKPHGKPEEQCGDNLYYQEQGVWKRLPSRFHNTPGAFSKDVGKDRAGRPVFVATHFYYFGDQRVVIPDRLSRVIRYSPTGARGVQYREGHLVDDFLLWLEANHAPGIIGHPKDIEDKSAELGTLITDDPGLGFVSEENAVFPTTRSGGCQ